MDTRNPQAGDQMRRQLAKQHKQQEQEQQLSVNRFRSPGRDLPAKQDQTRHNPVTDAEKSGSFTSDQ
jgi:hypothetical protein